MTERVIFKEIKWEIAVDEKKNDNAQSNAKILAYIRILWD